MKHQSSERQDGLTSPRRFTQIGRTAEMLAEPAQARATETLCAELQKLFDTFNYDLFARELPDCMLTVDTAYQAAYGFFRPDAFTRADGTVIDQIALNPTYILSRPMCEVAGTVAHEMAHLWVHRCAGKRITSGYHCAVWGRKMRAIGLMPSNTGRPGGKQTGYQMTHYAMAGGRFLESVAALEAQGFSITRGRFQRELGRSTLRDPNARGKRKGKVKFACPVCGQACWGSSKLNLICGRDRCPLMVMP